MNTDMDLLNYFWEINWISVTISALVAFGIGGLWYSPVLFGKSWQKLIELSDDEIKEANMGMIFGLTFALNLLAAIVLELILGIGANFLTGLLTGLLISLAFIATSFGINYLFARKPVKLFLIDAGYFVVFFTVMGAILGAL